MPCDDAMRKQNAGIYLEGRPRGDDASMHYSVPTSVAYIPMVPGTSSGPPKKIQKSRRVAQRERPREPLGWKTGTRLTLP